MKVNIKLQIMLIFRHKTALRTMPRITSLTPRDAFANSVNTPPPPPHCLTAASNVANVQCPIGIGNTFTISQPFQRPRDATSVLRSHIFHTPNLQQKKERITENEHEQVDYCSGNCRKCDGSERFKYCH